VTVERAETELPLMDQPRKETVAPSGRRNPADLAGRLDDLEQTVEELRESVAMLTADLDDRLRMYRERMQQTVYRTQVVIAILDDLGRLLFEWPAVESIYLQFRKILELIATASLSVNESAGRSITARLQKKPHAEDILKEVERVNPDFFYPKHTRLVEDDPVDRWEDFTGDYLTREKFTSLYALASSVVHTPHPFRPPKQARTNAQLRKQAKQWCERIIRLLTHHHFELMGYPGLRFVCHNTGTPAEPVLRTTIFRKAGNMAEGA